MSHTTVQPAQTPSIEGQQDYPVDFIHIGLAKCASTYLQQLWFDDTTYHLLDSSPIVRALRTVAERSAGQTIQFKAPPRVLRKHNVLSSEGLTWGWLNHPEKQAAIKPLQELAARVLGEGRLSGRVLIIVRDPVALLRAVHEQTIKEGGHASYAEFLGVQRKLCEAILDLRFMIDTFQKYWDSIVVLSADELRNAPEDFWAKYAARLSMPEPSKETLAQLNGPGASLNKSLGNRTPLLAQLNRFATAATDCYESLSEYKALCGPEYERMKPFVDVYMKGLNRRLVEFASDEALQPVTALLAPNDVAAEEVFVDQALHDWIETQYLQPLEGLSTIPEELLSQYRRSLAAALKP
ncbi:hypothetical protein [Pelagibius marinus]|uniref:hypothetical protein n=1 Tax=Pelagibius marinus TaxID=2762760 RepID=UPI0018724E1B|nr:hypothetical protein [Pelagibius marinus]